MIRVESLTKKWPIKTLGECVDFWDHLRKPIKSNLRQEGDFPYYGANGQQGTINGYIFDDSLILLAEDGGFFGQEGKTIAYRVYGKCWVNNHAHVLKVKKGIDFDYLFYVLSEYDVTPFTTGTTRAKLTKSDALKIPIPLPPLAEQRRIAAILDKADAIRRKRQQSLELADSLLKSVFLDMFGDPVTNPKGWETSALKTFGNIVTGSTPSRENSDSYGDGIEWAKSDNINTPYHFLTEAKEQISSKAIHTARVAPPGSILVTCIAGSRDCIGNSAITNRNVSFNQQINAIIPTHSWMTNFIYGQIFTQKKIIQQASTESMKGMVSKGRMENIMFLSPPKDLVFDFSKKSTQIFMLSSSLWKAQAEANHAFKSLQQSFFG